MAPKDPERFPSVLKRTLLPELQEVVDAWEELPQPLKDGILAIVRGIDVPACATCRHHHQRAAIVVLLPKGNPDPRFGQLPWRANLTLDYDSYLRYPPRINELLASAKEKGGRK